MSVRGGNPTIFWEEFCTLSRYVYPDHDNPTIAMLSTCGMPTSVADEMCTEDKVPFEPCVRKALSLLHEHGVQKRRTTCHERQETACEEPQEPLGKQLQPVTIELHIDVTEAVGQLNALLGGSPNINRGAG